MAVDVRKLEDLPRSPGVYMMKDARGKILYVGKAKDLRARVRSYFVRSGDGRHTVRFLLERVDDIDVVVTSSEKEALILENALIKQHHPRYNIAFRDDKNYLHIRIDINHPFPRIHLVRRPKKDGALYFGPYASSQSVRRTLRLIQQYMGLRTCKDSQLQRATRTCLQYQMGRCSGVCRGEISREQYAAKVQEAILFLKGKSKQLIKHLEERMKDAAEALRFEEAARIRDQIRAIERTLEVQRVVQPLGPDQDVIGLHRDGQRGMIVVLRVREGIVSETLQFPLKPTPFGDEEVLSAFIKRFYDTPTPLVPEEILLPRPLGEETSVMELWLQEVSGRKVQIRCPVKGKARALVEMAQHNAAVAYLPAREELGSPEALARALRLRRVPHVIEGFDISNLGGGQAYGSAVRFVGESPQKSSYRIYGIRTVPGQDDYAMMYELLSRHLERRRQEDDLPDLLVLDGGKGQLSVALAVLKDLSLNDIEAVALAKGRQGRKRTDTTAERVYVPGRKEAVSLAGHLDALNLLRHVRDEAHRFAISRHRGRRQREQTHSLLDEIPGVGPARRQALLRHFGGIQRLARANVEELCKVPGISRKLAQVIHDHLQGEPLGQGPP